MRKLVLAAIMLSATSVFAAEQHKVSAKTVPDKDVKILFANNDTTKFSETSTIQPQSDWYLGTNQNVTTVKQMIQQGWTLQNMVALNGKQYFIIFVK